VDSWEVRALGQPPHRADRRSSGAGRPQGGRADALGLERVLNLRAGLLEVALGLVSLAFGPQVFVSCGLPGQLLGPLLFFALSARVIERSFQVVTAAARSRQGQTRVPYLAASRSNISTAPNPSPGTVTDRSFAR
jgi:hypothetical protein